MRSRSFFFNANIQDWVKAQLHTTVGDKNIIRAATKRYIEGKLLEEGPKWKCTYPVAELASS